MLHPFAKPFAIQNPSAPEIHRSAAPKGPPGRERRGRPGVLLELPVRVRWLGPFGLETEITQTRNASRDGVLVSSDSSRQPGSLLWATFPYDPAVAFTESETPGKVARSAAESVGKNIIAISFHQNDPISPGDVIPSNDSSSRRESDDRRCHARISLAYLVRVTRTACTSPNQQAPIEPFWPEETMTLDVSPDGMIFCTLRIYSLDEQLLIAAQAGRKLSGGERQARVVRVSRADLDSPVSYVAVKFLS